MNIALEQTEELVNGAVKNAFGDAFIRVRLQYFIVPVMTDLVP